MASSQPAGSSGTGDRTVTSTLEGALTMTVLAVLTVGWVGFWALTLRNHLRLGHTTAAVTTGLVMVVPALVLLYTFLKTLLGLIGAPGLSTKLPGEV